MRVVDRPVSARPHSILILYQNGTKVKNVCRTKEHKRRKNKRYTNTADFMP